MPSVWALSASWPDCRLFTSSALAAQLAVIAPIVYFFGMKPYQQDRVLIFLNPENDPLGAGYHITQSKIAIGSGGIFGKGFGNGTQSHLDYLPEGHTDFVFATMAEEWGIVGGFFILVLYFLLMRWGLTVAMESKTRYGQLVAAGLTCTIFFYIMINLLMVVGLAPVAGIPLPFVSHGGIVDADDDDLRRHHHVDRTSPRREAGPIQLNRHIARLTKAPNPIKGGAPNGPAHLASPKWGRLAQLVEQLTLNQRVVGSNPSASTIFINLTIAYLIELSLATSANYAT